MHISAQNQRYSIQQNASGIAIHLSVNRNWFHLLFMCIWLALWAYGERMGIQSFQAPGNQDQRSEILWLCGWTLAGLGALGGILWQLFGAEIVSVGSGTLVQRIQIFGLGINKRFDLHAVKNLRAAPEETLWQRKQKEMLPPLFGAGHGAIVFDYGARSMYLGVSLDETETKQIMAAIQGYLPAEF